MGDDASQQPPDVPDVRVKDTHQLYDSTASENMGASEAGPRAVGIDHDAQARAHRDTGGGAPTHMMCATDTPLNMSPAKRAPTPKTRGLQSGPLSCSKRAAP